MKVINTDLPLYPFLFIPRRYDFGTLSFVITREKDNKTYTPTANDTIGTAQQNSLGYITFVLDTTDKGFEVGGTYTINIFDTEGVVYRGKLFVTNKSDLQNYEILEINDNIIDL